jgi:hypothetical protein
MTDNDHSSGEFGCTADLPCDDGEFSCPILHAIAAENKVLRAINVELCRENAALRAVLVAAGIEDPAS